MSKNQVQQIMSAFRDILGDLAPAVEAAMDMTPEDNAASFVTANLSLASGFGFRLSLPAASPVMAVLALDATLKALVEHGVIAPPVAEYGPEVQVAVDHGGEVEAQAASAGSANNHPNVIYVDTNSGKRKAYRVVSVEHAGVVASGRNAGRSKYRVTLAGTQVQPMVFPGRPTDSLVEAAMDAGLDFLLPMQAGQTSMPKGEKAVYAVTNEDEKGNRWGANGSASKYLNVLWFVVG